VNKGNPASGIVYRRDFKPKQLSQLQMLVLKAVEGADGAIRRTELVVEGATETNVLNALVVLDGRGLVVARTGMVRITAIGARLARYSK
jgi:hypothetical protein